MIHRLIAPMMLTCALTMAAAEPDYTKGILIVNEDWYGHQNSTVNYLLPDDPEENYWQYRVVQTENPGYELGCTNQYGAIWNGRLYLIAKQDKDPGASITGGRITVCDAKTMKILHQSSIIDPSGAQCDGRGFVGVTPDKGYISTSNGVWIIDLNSFEIKGQVEGTANPNAGGDNDKPNTDPTGSLYHGQSGMMVLAAGRVFAAHQSAGLLVIDPETDSLVNTISMDIVREGAGIGSVVLAKDGSLWLSVAGDITGMGTVVNKLVRVDPVTLDTEVVQLEQDIYGPSNSWYAWTPDAFCASSVTNSLYWKGGANSWFSGVWIYRFDIDTRHAEKIIDLNEDGENWKLYGCSMRVHPVTDEIYMSLYHEFSIPTYITRRYTASGSIIRDYNMISNYWFPSLPVFPEQEVSGVADAAADDAVRVWADGRNIRVDGTESFYVYDTSGRPCGTENLLPGLYIVRTSGTTTKILIK